MLAAVGTTIMRRFAAAIALVLAGCGSPTSPDVVGPQPQPVAGVLLTVRATYVTAESEGTEVVIRGAPGAVTPMRATTGTLRAFNVSVPGSVTTTPIAADGSFTLRMAAAVSDLLRIEAEDEQEVSFPLDLRGAPARIVEAPRGCVDLDEMSALSFRGAPGAVAGATIILRTTCGKPIPATVRLHVGKAFRFAGPTPKEIGAETALTIEHLGAFPADDLVIIETNGEPAILAVRARIRD